MENEEYEKEKDIKGNSNSIFYEILETILEQMRNCICLINCKKGGNGTGFFCKFPFPDKYNLLPVLITNNHVLEQKDISNGEEIKILMKKKDAIYLKIDKSRKVYTDEKYDITIIEIKPLDNLNIDSFLEIDDTIFKEKPNIEYRQKSVYLLHYPHSKNVEFSPGTIRSIDENDK